MTLLTGTDFTPAARTAARSAARLAAALAQPLHLVHVAHLPGPGTGTRMTPTSLAREELARREALLAAEAAGLAPLCARVECHILQGLPDEALLEHGERIGAQFLVLGPEGDRRHGLGELGSVAIRVLRAARVPVLVAREEQTFVRWLGERKPLRVVVGLDGSRPSHAALGWLRVWGRAGPIELAGVHVVEAGADGATEADLALRLEGLGQGAPRVHTIAGAGPVADKLVGAVAAVRADLFVVGAHRRGGLARLVHGSVSIASASLAPCNVVAVPFDERTSGLEAPQAVRRVLVPYDGSELALQALPWACALLSAGGEIVVLHVLVPHGLAAEGALADPLGDPTRAELERVRVEIAGAIAPHVGEARRARGMRARVELTPGLDAARAVAEAARRLEADVICMTTHGRSGIVRTVMGSVAQRVLKRAGVPVLVVPPPRQG
jgi:nucleotide-binding universal stress UspA family protein